MAKKKSIKKPISKAPSKAMINKVGVMPAGDRVLIKRMPPEEKTSFGLIIPENTNEKSDEGLIVAIGPGRKTPEGKVIPVSFEVGQRVRFSYGDEIKIGGIEHVLVHEDSITAIINK